MGARWKAPPIVARLFFARARWRPPGRWRSNPVHQGLAGLGSLLEQARPPRPHRGGGSRLLPALSRARGQGSRAPRGVCPARDPLPRAPAGAGPLGPGLRRRGDFHSWWALVRGGRGWGVCRPPGATLGVPLSVVVRPVGAPPPQAQVWGRPPGAEGAARATMSKTEGGAAADARDHPVPGALPGALGRLGALRSGGGDVAAAKGPPLAPRAPRGLEEAFPRASRPPNLGP